MAPEGVLWQSVRGNEIFPNTGAGARAKPVDQFFACVLGKTAAELPDPATAAATYTALYTGALLDALNGTRDEVLEPAEEPGATAYVVRPDRLAAYLENEIPRRVRAARLASKVNQEPEASILSRGTWLSRIQRPATLPDIAPPPVPRTLPNLRDVAVNLIGSAAGGDPAAFTHQLDVARNAPVTGAERLAETVDLVTPSFGPDHFETQCGIKVRGARILDAFVRGAHAEPLGRGGDLVRIDWLDHPAPASVLLRFSGGAGTVIPVIPQFLAILTFEGRELVDVAYEPSANTPRWHAFKDRASEVRALRAVAASSSQHGRFHLEGADADAVAQKMQYAKGIDPTLAVYAAYAYHDRQLVERIRTMSRFLRDDIGATFFDLALLGRLLIDAPIGPQTGVIPFVPLLSQGWNLLRAHRVKPHPALDGIEATMKESLWSLFTAAGVRILRTAMESGELR